MHVVITGGAGFLGQRLARKILEQGVLTDSANRLSTVDRLTLVDVVPANDFGDARIKSVVGDIADAALVRELIGADVGSVFHLAAIVSGQAEADFDLGMRINLDATRLLLEACRAQGNRPKFVFTSSVAVYGGALPEVVQDATALNPRSSYGVEKAIGELLVNEYSRRGYIDGRVLRLPTISVRPGKPNKAASSFASGIIREPLNGEEAVCPVAPETRLWLLSPRGAIRALLRGHEIAGDALGDSRTLNLPGVSVSVAEMVEALRRAGGEDAVARIRWEADATVARIVGGWPAVWDASRALALGLEGDADFDAVVRAYVEDDLRGGR
ncbi:D-erythronate dehydrogenase [Noviherbaspirillum pedocola]|uniref:SDR family oxidoreductase n=1 Tax=Noviherbaspirillum pedocola TaxID=2801341 RepID=A0A934W7R8_9BURK|nr:D-erythronate dehydrogenase [Noviherbaspirillum pedocola]MBK4737757.1 SDR family oxidoreductase [Noviherbaspirillum pedocola]